MPVVIDPKNTFVTQINHIKVAPENQDKLVAFMTEQLEKNIASQPGFISASIHRSHDGRHVVNYVQWTTKELLDAAHAQPEFRSLFEQYRGFVIDGGPALYEISVQRQAH
jgi:heme-degrading monooxygenase HmoA